MVYNRRLPFKSGLLLFLFVTGSMRNTHAQIIPSLIEQITALHELEHTIIKGYRLVTRGLDTIGSIRNEEFDEHNAFFSSLLKTKSAVFRQVSTTQNTLIMTKQSLILLIGLFSNSVAVDQLHAQSIPDLLVQLSLDTQKLSSLKSTLQEMYTGYDNLKKEYTHIRDIARDNFNLHRLFLDGLWVLSPNVRNDPRLSSIFNTQAHFLKDYTLSTARLGDSNLPFSPQEISHILETYSTLLQLTVQSIDELSMVTTDNQLRMSDAQRLQAIDRIDGASKTRLALLEQFNTMLSIQINQRQKAASDINSLKSLYGISN